MNRLEAIRERVQKLKRHQAVRNRDFHDVIINWKNSLQGKEREEVEKLWNNPGVSGYKIFCRFLQDLEADIEKFEE